MAKVPDSLVNFSGGEVSPKLDARIDWPKYRESMRQALNVILYKTGGWTRAPGTQMIAPTKFSTTAIDTAISVPFVFSPSTTFSLEFGANYIRFYSNGQQVVLSTAPAWVSGFYYNPGNYSTSGINGLIYLRLTPGSSSVDPSADAPNWVQQTILEIPNTPYNAQAVGGNPFLADIRFLQFEQVNDVIYITHPSYAPAKLSRLGDTNWQFEYPVPFNVPALLDQNATNISITASATTGINVTLTANAPAWSSSTFYTVGDAVSNSGNLYNCVTPNESSGSFATDLAAGFWVLATIFVQAMIGGTWELSYVNNATYLEVDGTAAGGFSNGTSGTIQVVGGWEVHTYGVWSSDIAVQQSLDGGKTWNTVEVLTSRSDANYDVTGESVVLSLYRFVVTNSAGLVSPGATNPRVVFTVDNAFIDGLVTLNTVTGPYTATAAVIQPLLNTGATVYWSEAAWSNYRGFPAAITAFQQRMIYGGSGFEPQRIWGTRTDDLENFDLGDQSLATDSFAFDLNASSRGPIVWLIAQLDLFVGFTGAEWVVNSGSTNATGQSSGAAITPTSVNAFESSSWGSAQGVSPDIVGDVVMFTQRQATSIRKILFDVYAEKYLTSDLTELADHLFSAGIVQIAYQSRFRKQSILWAVTQQGTLCAMTYELDKQITGWSRRQTGFGAFTPAGVPINPDNGFESVSVIPGKGQNDDEVWCVVNRLINGTKTRFIERVNPNNWEETFSGAPNPAVPNLANAYYVDCGLTTSGGAGNVVTGLSYLNGRYVVGLADGQPFGPLLVAGGQVTVPSALTVGVVQVGLPINYSAQPMRFDADALAGNSQGKVKQIDGNFYLRVWNSIGGNISNGTANYQTWTAGLSYPVGVFVISPLTLGAFQSIALGVSGIDPSQDTTHWTAANLPNYQPPVPIPYVQSQPVPFAIPFGIGKLSTKPIDIEVPPQMMPSPDHDPQLIVTGNDALPITVLALVFKKDVSSG